VEEGAESMDAFLAESDPPYGWESADSDAGGDILDAEEGKIREPVSQNDFHFMSVIGSGSFGKVLLVKHKKTSELYAMKVLKKAHIKAKKQIAHTLAERRILSRVDSPFVVKLYWSFQTDDRLFFVLSYCAGGEVRQWNGWSWYVWCASVCEAQQVGLMVTHI